MSLIVVEAVPHPSWWRAELVRPIERVPAAQRQR